jgi:hypothetical protein
MSRCAPANAYFPWVINLTKKYTYYVDLTTKNTIPFCSSYIHNLLYVNSYIQIKTYTHAREYFSLFVQTYNVKLTPYFCEEIKVT